MRENEHLRKLLKFCSFSKFDIFCLGVVSALFKKDKIFRKIQTAKNACYKIE